MDQKRTEFIAVGTELLLGQIANTNAQWFSKQLAAYGFNMFHHTVVGDNLQRVKDVFMQAQERSDVVIVSGGLGPTEDDLTREAFQALSNLSLIYDDDAMEKISTFYKKQSLEMTNNNKRQARIFKNAKVLQNKQGMAPGMLVTYKDVLWIFLPGVPTEMKQIATDEVFPYLIRQMSAYEMIESRVLKCIGIGESTLEEELIDVIEQQDNPTIALLSENDGITIRLTVKAANKEQAENKLNQMSQLIYERVGQYIYGSGNDTIERKIIQLLENKGYTISAAESLTGGAFTNTLIKEAGASNVCPGSIISYGTNIKQDVLQISHEIIEQHGVVSESCAVEMAKQVSKRMDTTLGISFTGVAGPSTIEGKEVGTTFISIYANNEQKMVRKFIFSGDRQSIQKKASMKGFELLYHYLME